MTRRLISLRCQGRRRARGQTFSSRRIQRSIVFVRKIDPLPQIRAIKQFHDLDGRCIGQDPHHACFRDLCDVKNIPRCKGPGKVYQPGAPTDRVAPGEGFWKATRENPFDDMRQWKGGACRYLLREGVGEEVCGRPADDFGLREGQEFDCLDPRCKRVRRDSAEKQVRRTGDKEAAWAGDSIDGSLSRQQQARSALHDLDHCTIKPANKACGIGLGCSANIIVIERESRICRETHKGP